MIQIAICEDLEPDFIATKALIEKYMTNRCLEYHLDAFKSGEAFLRAWQPGRYALVILDMILPGADGMEIARNVRRQDPDCRLIITTVSPEFALDGYRVQAVDYLMKPVDFELLSEALDRCALDVQSPSVSVIINQTETMLPVSDIHFAEIFGNHLLIHTVDAVIKTYLSLSAFEKQLPQDTFVRISRSHLVNMHNIVEISGDTVRMSGGEKLAVSRRRKREVKQAFHHFLINKARRPSCE